MTNNTPASPTNRRPIIGQSVNGSIENISLDRQGVVLRNHETIIGSVLVNRKDSAGQNFGKALVITDNTVISVQDGQQAVFGSYESLQVGQDVAVRFIELGDLDVAPGGSNDVAVEITVFK